MRYVAVRNFRFNEFIVNVGEFYNGGDVDKLLALKLIAPMDEPQPAVKGESGGDAVKDDQAPPLPTSLKKRKKKS